MTSLAEKRRVATRRPEDSPDRYRIMIAVPNLGWIRMALVNNLVEWIQIYGGIVHMPEGYRPVSYARNMCVEALLQSDCTHIWFVDSDTVPQPDAMNLLLGADKDVITGVTRVLKEDTDKIQKAVPMVAVFDPNATNPDGTKGGYRPVMRAKGIGPIDVCGASCLMIKRAVFEKLGDQPLFTEESWGDNRGEDFRFCQKLAEAGVEMWAHFDVKCVHWTTVPL